MKIIRKKKALVTGAASGIGRAIALALAADGADLYLVDVDGERLDLTASDARRYGGVVVTDVRDLSDPKQVTAVAGAVLSTWGQLNILVNNAGTAYYGPTHEMTKDQWDKILSLNLLTPIQLVRELLRHFLRKTRPALSTCAVSVVWCQCERARLTRRPNSAW